ncbi:putative D,D-dipeptide transport ATP-binding protein DdpF [compost metagenome]
MYLGRIVEVTDKYRLYDEPQHPYTQALLSAVPEPDPDIRKERVILQGEVPSPANAPVGCAFNTRCPRVMDVCRNVRPPLMETGAGHLTACHLYDGEANVRLA